MPESQPCPVDGCRYAVPREWPGWEDILAWHIHGFHSTEAAKMIAESIRKAEEMKAMVTQ